MARFKVTEVYEFAMGSQHTSTSWEIYKSYSDGVYSGLLFSSLEDPIHLLGIVATLVDPDTGELYDTNRPSVCRVKLHYGTNSTKWHGPVRCMSDGLPKPFDYQLQ